MLIALATLLGVGIITLYSASNDKLWRVDNQIIHISLSVAGLFLAVIVTQFFPSTFLQRASIWFYILGLVVLLLVIFVGEESKGAKRWLNIGVARIQPSEFMKIIVPLMVARYFADKTLPPRFIDLVWALLIVIVPVLLIASQPDLGTALLVASAGLFGIFFTGISWKWIIGSIVSLMVAAPLLFFYGMHDYQRQRVMTLFDPTLDRYGSGYHILQSFISLGSGGMNGKGWMHGDQVRLGFLPERHTDFIFAVIGEEYGLTGVVMILLLYLFIIYRGLYLAACGRDTFARILGGCFALTFFVYLFVNTGMVSGILPVVGVPMPLVSYGGTSLLSLMITFGLMMGLRKKARKY
ncbi:MAG: rod shape-determining protein RodA [Thiotrichaceae bacterium]|nr:rod shape-determining protein RodA [Thiotrichaceae bacterium]